MAMQGELADSTDSTGSNCPNAPVGTASAGPGASTATAVSASVTESIRAWVAAWGNEVASVDLAAGRRRFDPAAVAFGTHADLIHGVDQLHDRQWSAIWPTITGFAFREDEMVTMISSDGNQAVVAVTWESTGYSEAGAAFDRPGRATIVLQRDATGDEWRCRHTHFSLAHGVPSETHGHPDTRAPRS